MVGDHSIKKELSLDKALIKNPENTFFIRSNGDSMAPTIWDGDTLIVSIKKKVINGSTVLIQMDNGQYE